MKTLLKFTSLSFLCVFLLTGCSGNYSEEVDIPFHPCTTGVSAASATLMVAAYYNRSDLVGHEDYVLWSIVDSNNRVSLPKIAWFLSCETVSEAVEIPYPATDDGQNQALSMLNEYVARKEGSIMILVGEHFVPVVKTKGHYDKNGNEIADYIWFHAYDKGYQCLAVAPLKQYYMKPRDGKIWIIVCQYTPELKATAASNYQWFKDNGGTYYGAPANYVPSNKPVL